MLGSRACPASPRRPPREGCVGAPLPTGRFGRAGEVGRLRGHQPPASASPRAVALQRCAALGSGSAGARVFLPWPLCRGGGCQRWLALGASVALALCHLVARPTWRQQGTAVAVGWRLFSRYHGPSGAGCRLPPWVTQARSVLGARPLRCLCLRSQGAGRSGGSCSPAPRGTVSLLAAPRAQQGRGRCFDKQNQLRWGKSMGPV